MPAPTLKTKRLLLRHWTKDDYEPFCKMNTDEKVMQFFPSLYSKSQNKALYDAIIKELSENPFGLWAIEESSTKTFIGFAGLHKQEFKAHFTPCIELGWRIASSHWRQGFALEASCIILKHGFCTLGLKEIVAFTAKLNIPSFSLMKKIGFQYSEKDDFIHPKLEKASPLAPHLLCRMNLKEGTEKFCN